MLPHPQTPFPTSSVWSFYTDQVGRSGNEARKSRSSFPEFVLRLLILSPKLRGKIWNGKPAFEAVDSCLHEL